MRVCTELAISWVFGATDGIFIDKLEEDGEKIHVTVE